jgi:hypothetical protein
MNREVFVVLAGGLVREVVGLEPGTKVVVVDYDTEEAAPEDLEASPLDGEPCHLRRF